MSNMYNTEDANAIEELMRRLFNQHAYLLHEDPERGRDNLIEVVLIELNERGINVASEDYYQNIWYDVVEDIWT